MSKRYPGGLITKTPVTPTTTSAPGVWTLEQALQYIKAGTWPLYVLTDPYFNYVTMLLHGDGTNGAQNNTFLDSSTNNFTITRNGNATQGSFSPYGSNWSNYLTGSSYLTWSGTSIGTNAFTFECWFYYTGTSFPPAGQDGASFIGPSSASSSALNLNIFNSTTVAFDRYGVSNDNFTVPTLVANTWYHIAFVRNASNVTTVFLNGTRSSTGTVTSSYNYSGTTNAVGYTGGAVSRYFPGYISNARLVIGSAVYDPTQTTITVPTTPLTAISGTSLLTCQSNRFIDNSTNAFAVSLTGSPSVQRFSPFSPSSAYSTSTIGGSYYSPGASGLATTYSGSVGSTADFTVEGWFYLTANADNGNLAVCAAALGIIFTQSGQKLSSYFPSTGFIAWQSTALVQNTWHHIVVQRSSSTLSCYLNGTLLGTRASATGGWNWNDSGLYLLGQGSVREVGYTSNVRISNIARYSGSTISVPTSPVTSDANTTFLLNFTNGGIFDNAMMNNLQTVGDAQISTSVVKYGTGSMKFDGTGDYLVSPAAIQFNASQGNWTIEAWVNFNSNTQTQPLITGNPRNFYFVYVYETSQTKFILGDGSSNPIIVVISPPAAGTWWHMCCVKNGSTYTVYMNGVAQASTTTPLSNTTLTGFNIGYDSSGPTYFNGYIDDLRITKGYARYTSNFTPPAAAFPNQ